MIEQENSANYQAEEQRPISVQEFSKRIKEKYPSYKDVDDSVLTAKIIEKYPQYKDKVSFESPQTQTEATTHAVEKTTKEPSFFTEMGARFTKSNADLGSMLSKTPGFLYDVVAIPQNIIADKFNIPSLKTSSQQVSDVLGIKNKVAEYYDKGSEYYSQKIADNNPKYQKGIIESATNGDWATAGRNLLGGIIESSAPSIAMIVTAGAGAPTMLGTSTAVFGAGKKTELDKNVPQMSEQDKTMIALSNGAIEGLFETALGSGAIGSALKNVVTRSFAEGGEELAKKEAKKLINQTFVKMLEKNPELGMLGEGLEEVGTQFAQNAVDKYSGYRPDIGLADGAGDAFLTGFGMGGMMSAPIRVAQYIGEDSYNNVQKRTAAKKEFQAAFTAFKDIPNANYTEAVENIFNNYTDPKQISSAFNQISQDMGVSQPEYQAAFNFLQSSVKVNSMNKAKTEEIQKGIETFKGADGNVTTALINGEEYFIRNVQDLGQDNRAIFAKNKAGEVKPFNSNQIKEWSTKSPDEIIQASGIAENEEDNLYNATQEIKQAATDKGIEPDRSVQTPNGIAKVASVNDDGTVTVVNQKGIEDVFNIDEVEPYKTKEQKEQEKALIEQQKQAEKDALLQQKENEKIQAEQQKEAEKAQLEADQLAQQQAEARQAQTDIPVDKDGNPDYDQMEPEMFFTEYSKEFGEEEAKTEIKGMQSAIVEKIKELGEKKAKATSANDRAKITREIKSLNGQLDNIAAIIEKDRPKAEDLTANTQWIAKNSVNPDEIALAYEQEEQNAPAQSLAEWQKAILGVKFNPESFNRFSDPNNVTQTLAKAWLNKDGSNIDQFIRDNFEDVPGFENVTEQDIVDFIVSNPTGNVRKTTDTQKELRRKYREVTGTSIDNRKFDQETRPTQDKIDRFLSENNLSDSWFSTEDLINLIEANKDKLQENDYNEFTQYLNNEISNRQSDADEWLSDETELQGEVNPNQESGSTGLSSAEKETEQPIGISRSTQLPEERIPETEMQGGASINEVAQRDDLNQVSFENVSQNNDQNTDNQTQVNEAGESFLQQSKNEQPKSFPFLNISPKATEDLKERRNALNALNQISSELNQSAEIINSEEIPENIKNIEKQRIAEGKEAVGFFNPDDGKIYIISDRITKVSETKKTFIHEMVVHKGLKGLFDQGEQSIIGKQYQKFNDLMTDVFNSMEQKDIDFVAGDYIPDYSGKENLSDSDKSLIGEEYLASLSESETIPTKWQSFIDRLVHLIRKTFGLTSGQFTQSDLLNIIKEQRERLTNTKENASTIRSNERRIRQEGNAPKESGANGRENIQRAQEAGGTTSDQREQVRLRITPEQAKSLPYKPELPISKEFIDAVNNTQGAKITDEGLIMNVVRFQRPEQEGELSVRTGVFYLPSGDKNVSYYKTGKNGYGGNVKEEGETLIKKPIFVKGATGGKAPENAYDQIKGKGEYQKMRTDVLKAIPGYNKRTYADDVYNVLDEYGADPDLAWHIVDKSKVGNTLPYAVQENIVAHAVREAGYDAVIGYSTKRDGTPFISEIFDVREITYPSKEVESDIHNDFLNEQIRFRLSDKLPETININGVERSTTNSKGQPIADTEEKIRNFYNWFGDSKVVDEQGKPLVVYHGTDKTFNKINMKKGSQGLFWVTSDKSAIEAGEVGASGKGKIMELYAKIESPASWDQYKKLMLFQFESRGLDGAVLPDPDGSFVAFVKNPNQIKSASKNTGEFDESNPDIRFRMIAKNPDFQKEHERYNRKDFEIKGDNLYTTVYSARFDTDHSGEFLGSDINIDKAIDYAESNPYDYDYTGASVSISAEHLEIPVQEIIDNTEDDEFKPEDITEYEINDFLKGKDTYKYTIGDDYYTYAESEADNANTDDLIYDVQKDLSNRFNTKIGKYSTVYVNKDGNITGKQYDDNDNENREVSIRIADHTHNPQRGRPDVAVVIANKNATSKKFFTASEDFIFDENDTSDDIADQIEEFIKDNFTPDIRFRIDKASEEVNTNPTDAQKSAGNYAKGHVRFDGFDISIENPKGSTRSGTDTDGNKWEAVLPADYGYFRGTVGKDKDHIDVFIGDKPEVDKIYVVDQINPKTGAFDEHKVMLGFDNISKARNTYEKAYPKDWKGLQSITRTTKEGLKDWFENGNTKKPFAGQEKSEPLFRVQKAEKAPESVNETVKENLKAAHGIKKEPLKDKVQRWTQEMKETTQHFKYVTEKEFPSVYNKLRLFESIPEVVRKEAYEKIADIVRPIVNDKNLYEGFEKYIVLRDLMSDINRGLYEGKELPWGYTDADEVRRDVDNIQKYVNDNPWLRKAIANRNSLIYKTRDELIKNKLLSEKSKEKEDYFHHQVLSYMEEKISNTDGAGSRDVRLHKKGWQRSRTGSMKAYNTNYLESEFEVIAQSLAQVEIKDILNKIGNEVNIMPSLIAKSNEANELIAQENMKSDDPKDWGKFTTWKEFIPEGYSKWYPKSGTNAYKAASMAEKAVQNIIGEEMTPEMEEMIAEADRSMWVIPTPIAKQLDSMKTPEREILPVRGMRYFNASWKQWILMNPYRVIKYNLNNTSGDLDIVLAYDPRILKPQYAHNALKELHSNLIGKGLSQDMKEALSNGVITSGLSISEIPDINQEGIFKSLTGHDNLIMQYWNKTKDYTQFRENLLRLATYKYFKDQITKGKKVYGASNKAAIDALTDTNEKAGKLARELIGDYGNLSQGGQWLRSHIYPFWSWMEVNAPRYYRLLRNTAVEDQSGLRTAGAVATKTALNATKLTGKMLLLAGMVTLWNNLFFHDEDEELTKTGNRQLRLIVGRRDDGSIMTIRISGAFSDVLSFIGLEDAPQDIRDIQKGNTTIGKKVKEGGSAFVNKFAQGAMPIEKTAAEVILGKSFYPDVFNPRPIRDRAEQALKTVSMDKIYRYLAKKPLRGAKELSGLIVYDTDPGEAAYYTMRQRIYDFLDQKEIERPSGEPTERSNALYYYKQSKKLGDVKLANHWLAKYMALGGTKTGMKASIKKGEVLSPLGKMKKEFQATLDAEDREVLQMANEWYENTYDK